MAVAGASAAAQSVIAGVHSAIPEAAFHGVAFTATDSARPPLKLPTGPSAALVCRDFYSAVNSDWIATTPLPVDTTKDDVVSLAPKRDTIRVDQFFIAQSAARATLVKILTAARAVAATTTDPVTRVLGNFYNSCMLTPNPDSVARSKEKDGGVNRCLNATDEVLNNALGRAYVNAVSTPATEARVKAMAEQLRAAMADRIKKLTWMSPETKNEALVKLAAMRFRVGNPDKGEDYNALHLSPTDFEANKRDAAYVQYQRDIEKFGAAPDKNTVGIRQYTVNAYYIPNMNAMEIPAVLFQEPFFNQTADAVENYAGLGFIVGHEITHAFDTYGSQYDTAGLPHNWWTDADREHFLARAQKLVDQYDGFVTLEGVHLGGTRTLDENIADLGGGNLSFEAYMHNLGKKPESRAGGMTPEQRYFLALAEAWRAKSGPRFAMHMAHIDSHSPARFRVNGVIANMPEFAKAFGCKPGDPMVRSPAERAEIW